MLTPEIQAYIAEQRAAGFSSEVIHDALLTAGWAEKDIAEGLGLPMTTPATPTPAMPTSFDTPSQKKFPWAMIIIVMLLLALAVAGYFLYAKKAPATTSPPTTTPTPVTYSDGTNALGNFTYSYPNTWSAENIGSGTYLTDAPTSPSPSATPTATPNQLTQIAAASSDSNIIIIGNPYPLSPGTSTADVQALGIASQIDSSATSSTSIDGFSGYTVINRSTGSAMCEFILEGTANYFTVSFPLIQSCDLVPTTYHTIVKDITESIGTPSLLPSSSPSPSAS